MHLFIHAEIVILTDLNPKPQTLKTLNIEQKQVKWVIRVNSNVDRLNVGLEHGTVVHMCKICICDI